MTIVSGSNQSDIGDINLDNWLYRPIKPYSSVTLETVSWVDGLSLHTITTSMTSFTDDSDVVVLLY